MVQQCLQCIQVLSGARPNRRTVRSDALLPYIKDVVDPNNADDVKTSTRGW